MVTRKEIRSKRSFHYRTGAFVKSTPASAGGGIPLSEKREDRLPANLHDWWDVHLRLFVWSGCLFRLEKLALSLLLLALDGRQGLAVGVGGLGGGSGRLDVPAVVGDNGEDGALKDLVDAEHLLAAALHVLGVHLLRDGQPLLRRDGREPLRLEHVDACPLVAEVGLETDEDEGRVGAEVKDFGVPLRQDVSISRRMCVRGREGQSIPCRAHCLASWGSQWQSRRKSGPSLGRKADEGGRIPLVRRYPTEPALPSCQKAGGLGR